MPLVFIGLLVLGLSSAAWAAEVVPQLRQYWRKRQTVERTGPRVKTLIYVRHEKETTDDLL